MKNTMCFMALLRHIIMYTGTLPPDFNKYKTKDMNDTVEPLSGNNELRFLPEKRRGEL